MLFYFSIPWTLSMSMTRPFDHLHLRRRHSFMEGSTWLVDSWVLPMHNLFPIDSASCLLTSSDTTSCKLVASLRLRDVAIQWDWAEMEWTGFTNLEHVVSIIENSEICRLHENVPAIHHYSQVNDMWSLIKICNTARYFFGKLQARNSILDNHDWLL